MKFSKYYFTEVVDTPRKGIPHMFSGEYSMTPLEFIKTIRYIKSNNGGMIGPSNTKVTEKADGFSLIIGLDKDDRFFVESSHSGPVFDEGEFRKYTINKTGKTSKFSECYEDILKKLKSNSKLQKYLKSIKTDSGIKIQTEALYIPIGEISGSSIRFVATNYDIDRLGSWASFIIFNVLDGNGEQLDEDTILNIKKELHSMSTDELKFDYGDVDSYQSIDMSSEIDEVDSLISEFELEYHNKIDDIINNSDRSKVVVDQKKNIKQSLLSLQKKISNKLSNIITNGKFGDEYEGVILDVGNGFKFKIISDRFKEAKKQYNTSKTK